MNKTMLTASLCVSLCGGSALAASPQARPTKTRGFVGRVYDALPSDGKTLVLVTAIGAAGGGMWGGGSAAVHLDARAPGGRAPALVTEYIAAKTVVGGLQAANDFAGMAIAFGIATHLFNAIDRAWELPPPEPKPADAVAGSEPVAKPEQRKTTFRDRLSARFAPTAREKARTGRKSPFLQRLEKAKAPNNS